MATSSIESYDDDSKADRNSHGNSQQKAKTTLKMAHLLTSSEFYVYEVVNYCIIQHSYITRVTGRVQAIQRIV